MKFSVVSLLFSGLLVIVVSRGDKYYRDISLAEEDIIRSKFNDFDIDEDGQIEFDEFETIGKTKWRGVILASLLKGIYTDENDYLTYEQFKAMDIWRLGEMNH